MWGICGGTCAGPCKVLHAWVPVCPSSSVRTWLAKMPDPTRHRLLHVNVDLET